MTALYSSKKKSSSMLRWLNRQSPALAKEKSGSKLELLLRQILQDEKFNAEYDRHRRAWKLEGYTVHLYDSWQKVVVSGAIAPGHKGQVTFTGGVLHRAETGLMSKPLSAGQTAWAIARYGNTLLVVGSRTALLRKALS